VHSVTPLFESGLVYLPSDSPTNEVIIRELEEFPSAPFDDITNSITQALLYLRSIESNIRPVSFLAGKSRKQFLSDRNRRKNYPHRTTP
jgi:hypothetical protein